MDCAGGLCALAHPVADAVGVYLALLGNGIVRAKALDKLTRLRAFGVFDDYEAVRGHIDAPGPLHSYL